MRAVNKSVYMFACDSTAYLRIYVSYRSKIEIVPTSNSHLKVIATGSGIVVHAH